MLVVACNPACPDASQILTCAGPHGLGVEAEVRRLLDFPGSVAEEDVVRREERGDSSKDAYEEDDGGKRECRCGTMPEVELEGEVTRREAGRGTEGESWKGFGEGVVDRLWRWVAKSRGEEFKSGGFECLRLTLVVSEKFVGKEVEEGSGGTGGGDGEKSTPGKLWWEEIYITFHIHIHAQGENIIMLTYQNIP